MSDELDVIRFRVRRGTFTIPHGLQESDPDEWARRFASSMPSDGKALVSRIREGDLEVYTWRVVTPYRCAS
jgi:hypothetical protein